jgi:hypothetical protein
VNAQGADGLGAGMLVMNSPGTRVVSLAASGRVSRVQDPGSLL